MHAPLHNFAHKARNAARAPDPQAVRQAFVQLIDALGLETSTDAQTPERAASLWLEHLVAGQNVNLTEALGEAMPSTRITPIVLEPLGFHLVCPHHLTVASGTASIAYVPAGRIVGFGRLARLVEMATARPALQEDATADIAHTLMHTLGARAVAVRLRAEHLCHTVLHPRSHGAQATSWGLLGCVEAQAQLQAMLSA